MNGGRGTGSHPTETKRGPARLAAITSIGAAMLAMIASPVDAGAQQRPDPLGALVREALASNLSLEQQRLAEQRSRAGVREARGLYLPTLSFDARYSETAGGLDLGELVNPAYQALNQLTGSDRFPTNVDARLPFAQETKLRLTQPLYQPAIRQNLRLRRSLAELQGAALGTAARQLAADAQGVYLAYAQSVRVVELYRTTLPLLDENLRVSERLLANGKVTPEAVLRARADRAETVQQLAEAEQQSTTARRALNFVLGRELDAPVELLADSAIEFPLDVSLADALAAARAGREELRQTEAAVSAARAQERLARASSLPSLALAVDYGIQGDRYRLSGDDDFAVASLVLSWKAFDGGQDAARRQQASLDALSATTRRAELERQIDLQVTRAYEAATVARAAIATAEERVAAARRTFQLVARRYEEGMAPQVEYVDARTAHTRAGLNLILTRYQYAARWVELERAAALRPVQP